MLEETGFVEESTYMPAPDITGGFDCDESPKSKAVAESLQKLVHKAFDSAGPTGQSDKNFLNGKASALSDAMGSMRERNRFSTGESVCCEFDFKANHSGARFDCYMRGHDTPCVPECGKFAGGER